MLSFESHLVRKLIKEGNSLKDVAEIVGLMQNPDLDSPYKPLKLNNHKITSELRRQELLKEYNSSGERPVKNAIKRYLKKRCHEYSERLKQDESIIKVGKFVGKPIWIYDCSNCGTENLWDVSAPVKKLVRAKGGLTKTKVKILLFRYCDKCGYEQGTFY